MLAKLSATAKRDCTCLGHLGWDDGQGKYIQCNIAVVIGCDIVLNIANVNSALGVQFWYFVHTGFVVLSGELNECQNFYACCISATHVSAPKICISLYWTIFKYIYYNSLSNCSIHLVWTIQCWTRQNETNSDRMAGKPFI